MTVNTYMGLGAVGAATGLRSTVNGTQWGLAMGPASTTTIVNTNVQDSNASGGLVVYATSNTNVDNGNNIWWIFTSTQGVTKYWIASSPANWSNGAKWSATSGGPGGVGMPAANDQAIFDGNGLGTSNIDISVNISTLTTTSAFTGIINTAGNALTWSSGFALSSGTFNASSSMITVDGNAVLSAGVFNANTSSMTLAGNWSRNGSAVFNAGTSTVTFVGAAGSTSTLTGSTTFYNLVVNTPAKWINFTAGSTTTVSNLLNLTGTSGNLVGVRSTTPGQYSFLVNTGTNTVTFVDAEDNNASGGLMIRAGTNSHDSGNNVNWSFGEVAPISPTITAVFASSMTAAWTDVNYNTGYSLEASTGAWPNTFTGNVSSVTLNANATGLSFNAAQLAPNTTYFVQVGALYNGDTVYANTVPASTSTLTSLLQNAQVYGAFHNIRHGELDSDECRKRNQYIGRLSLRGFIDKLQRHGNHLLQLEHHADG